MLRITDVLVAALISEAIQLDRLGGQKKFLEGPHLQKLVTAIRECGVTFHVWEVKNADKSASGKYDFTSLMGPDKKKLISHLPSKLEGCWELNDVIQLWKGFREIYSDINLTQLPAADIDKLELFIAEWVDLFCTLGNNRPGYGKAKVTPYIHALAVHVPTMIRTYGTIRYFSGNGVEKVNDVARRIHHTKSNRWDATTDILLATGRQELLQHTQREKRKYSKLDEKWWNTGNQESRKKRPRHEVNLPGND